MYYRIVRRIVTQKMEVSKTDATTEVQQMNSMVDVDEIEDDIEDT